MKVNINGRGIIPGLGVVPPVYNQEMSEKGIARLLNFNNIQVYDSKTGAILTKKNYKNFFTTPTESFEVKVPEEIKQVETPITVTEEQIAESTTETLPEIIETPTSVGDIPVVDDHDCSGLLTEDVDTTKVETVEESDDVAEEQPVDEAVNEEVLEDVTEESSEEDNKPNNGNRNNNNYHNKNNRNKKNRH